jgi:hypothetical protein
MTGCSYASRRRLGQESKAGSDEYDDGNDGDGNNSRIGDWFVTSDHSHSLCHFCRALGAIAAVVRGLMVFGWKMGYA